MIRQLLIAGLFLGCSHHAAKPGESLQAAGLKIAYATRLQAYESTTKAQSGWPSVNDCDATVWAATACLGGAPVSIGLAEWAPGDIHRRPKAQGECYPQGAPSTISRDGLVLYMACAYQTRNIGALQALQRFEKANGEWMGQPHDPNYTLMTPTLSAILARAAQEGRGGPVIEAPGTKDYQDNIEVEEILLSTAVNNGVASGWEIILLDSLEAQYPNDALFQAARGIYSGDCTKAATLLTDPVISIPSYVRGDNPKAYADAWWLRAASLVLSHCT